MKERPDPSKTKRKRVMEMEEKMDWSDPVWGPWACE